ncbi:MAG: FkbM family methyltransferase [Alphaproteobacteria bacterium]
MTGHLVREGAFSADPLVIVDVGARGGVEEFWAVFGQDIKVVAFEPEPEEWARLNAGAPSNVTVLPHALGGRAERRKLHVATLPQASSFYPAREDFNSRFNFAAQMRVESEIELETTTLAVALGDLRPDFIKLDAEGAELEILRGADLGGILGLVAEVRFTELMSGCPTFSELDLFCREQGFHLYDLDLYRYSRTALPYPFLYDFRNARGEPAAGATTQGQILSGDALYFVDGLTAAKPLKLACLFEVFGLADCAAEVILKHGLDRTLLDLLVPPVKGELLTYAEYQRRTLASDSLFRPTPGRRFPEATIDAYDGKFLPSWQQTRDSQVKQSSSPCRVGFWDRLRNLFRAGPAA